MPTRLTYDQKRYRIESYYQQQETALKYRLYKKHEAKAEIEIERAMKRLEKRKERKLHNLKVEFSDDKRLKKRVKSKVKTLSYYKKKLDTTFQKFIRIRDSLETTGNPETCICITCGKQCSGTNLHAGHRISRRVMSLRRDEKNCHGQCAGCNNYGNGKPVEYRIEMVHRYGTELVEEMEGKINNLRKYTVSEIKKLIEKYCSEIDKMENI